MNIAFVLQAWRLQQSLSIRQAAKIIGINHSSYYQLENGRAIAHQNLATILKWLLSDLTDWSAH